MIAHGNNFAIDPKNNGSTDLQSMSHNKTELEKREKQKEVIEPISKTYNEEDEEEEKVNLKKLTEKDFREKYKDYYKRYYQGQPVDWSIIRKYTFERDCFNSIINMLDNNNLCLLTGAGGEGKTTLLMQIGDYYLKMQYEVYYNFYPIQEIDLNKLKKQLTKNYLIIIDNASAIKNIMELVTNTKNYNIKLLLASRQNEWNYYISTLEDSTDLNRFLIKPIVLTKLSNNELNKLSKLLTKHKVLKIDANDLEKCAEDDSSFLLSVMMYATQGESFESIIKSVIEKIQEMENGELTIKAISYIVSIEILGRGPYGIAYCPETLLKKMLNNPDMDTNRKIKKQLAEEAFFQGSLRKIIHTRNSNIAKKYFDILFDDNTGDFNKYDVYYEILEHCSTSSRTNDNINILSLIPPFFLKEDKELAIKLLKDTISYGFFWETYIVFMKEEEKINNIGSYDSDDYSVRWLFNKGYQLNSKNIHLYTNWANFELRQNKLGENIDGKRSARWICNEGIRMAPSSELYCVWAAIEADNNNVGKDVYVDHSARWICNEGIENNPSSALYITWAKIEAENKNIGKDVNEEYSARWICKEGIKNNPSSSLYITWANIEANAGKIGKDVNDKYSARWIYYNGIISIYSSPELYCAWAKLEAEAGKVGKDVNDIYSARWICKEGINKNPSSELYITWAKIEAEAGNMQKDVNEKHSARWICKEGIKKNPSSSLYITWANIEANAGNIGKNVNDKHSARWICNEIFNKTKELSCLFSWIKIEIKDGNIGNIDTPNSAEWLLALHNKIKPLVIHGEKIENTNDLKEVLNIE